MNIFNGDESVEVIRGLHESLKSIDADKDKIEESANIQCDKCKGELTSYGQCLKSSP